MHSLYYLVSCHTHTHTKRILPLAFQKMNRTESKGALFPTTPLSTQEAAWSFKTEIRSYHLPPQCNPSSLLWPARPYPILPQACQALSLLRFLDLLFPLPEHFSPWPTPTPSFRTWLRCHLLREPCRMTLFKIVPPFLPSLHPMTWLYSTYPATLSLCF